MAVASGMYDIAMAVGVEQMGKQGLLGGGGGGTDPAYATEGRLGSGLMPAVFGQAGIEHMRKYGTKLEHFAKISVKSHKHATKNPFSQYRNEVTLEDVLNARMVAYPNTLYMCCPTGDGAAAAILVSEEQAQAARRRPQARARGRLGADLRSVDRPRSGSARREHAHAARRQAGLREGGHRPQGHRADRAA